MIFLTTYPSTSNNPSGNNVNSPYGERWLEGKKSFHTGIDLYATMGTAILSAAPGTVRIASYDNNRGNYIVIEHGLGQSAFCTLYAHLQSRSVSVGENIGSGYVIGYAGSTGHSTGAHLHFETIDCPYNTFRSNQSGYCVDPYPYIVGLTANLSGSSSADVLGSISDPLGAYANYYPDLIRAAEEQVQLVKDENGRLIETVGSKFFNRRCSILILDGNGEFELDVSGLYVEFNCTKKVFSDFSPADIVIYNLNASTENQIIEKAKKIKIMAGYEGLFGTIYEGVIIQCVRYKESATDFCLKIKAIDQMLIGYLNLNEKAFASISAVTGMTKRQMMDAVASEQNISYEIKSGYNQEELDKPYIRGKVIFDTASNVMNDLKNSDGSYAYVDNGVLVYDNPEVMSPLAKDEIITLDPTSGLLGFPKQNGYEVTVETLINPRIKLNSLLHIDNRLIRQQEWSQGDNAYGLDIDGIYRVVQLQYAGVTRGNSWTCTIEAVSQQGVASVFTATEMERLAGNI